MLSKKLMSGLSGLVISAIFFTVGPVQSASGATLDNDDGFYEEDRPDDGYQGVLFRERPPWESTFSWLQVGGKPCEDITGNCLQYLNPDGTLPPFEFNSLLGPCVDPSETDCIEQVQASVDSGQVEVATFDRFFPNKGANDFQGNSRMRLPNGGTAGVWRFPSIRHGGGADFFLRVGVTGKVNTAKNPTVAVVDSQFSEIHATLFAVQEIAGNCTEDGIKMFCGPRKPTFSEVQNGTPLGGVLISPRSGVGWTGPTDCVMTSRNSRCLQRRALPENFFFRIVLRLSQSPSGWLHGRLSEPEMGLSEINEEAGYRLTLGGGSISVPVIKSGGSFAELPISIQDAYRNNGGFRGSPRFTRDFGCTKCADPNTRNMTSTPLAYGKDSFDELALWIPHVGDRASANLSTWSIRTIPPSQISSASSWCLKVDGTLKGLVATNATVYSAGPPTFDQNEKTLNYQVSAPHYTSGMQKFLGTYDLVMRSDTARCIYNLQSVPINATISLLDEDGETTVATTIMSERDGWLRLAAYGFGFSAPTIKIKLQAQPPAQIGAEIPVASNGSTKKRFTIVCVKKKNVRILTGIKPTCPKGFTRKLNSHTQP